MPPSGEPRESPKPQPIGNYPLIALFTICTLCALCLIWRRANSLRTVVAHQLKTWTGDEGRIRLSEDDGPPARSFVDNNDEEDEEDAEPLAVRVERLRSQRAGQEPTTPPATSIPKNTYLPTTPATGSGSDPLQLA
ncbi:hypothetical protein A7U60_g6973 [Sanghuangporus baumii]|uniref:Uncharacterized protein n=1 Tax=Sanghuangporus baumii TaxID=108892 RepID=A0A9Q5HUD2_SANBA|nr:hypothetical protein A7U60_g6973 [Sanghuangporus baumii]